MSNIQDKFNTIANNGCVIVDTLDSIKRCKQKITIICKCGHNRSSTLSNIVNFCQYLCKDCTKRKAPNNESKVKETGFKKRIASFENKFKSILKYKDDFNEINIEQKWMCRKCLKYKHRYLYFNRKNFKNSKEKICKRCVNDDLKLRRDHHNQEQVIMTCIYACIKNSHKRTQNGRENMCNIELNLDIIRKLIEKQSSKCIYTGLLLTYEYNNNNKMSIDRIDSSLGYIETNIQLVCKKVNWMKLHLSEEYFLSLIKQIYEWNNNEHTSVMSQPKCHMFDMLHCQKILKIALMSCKKRLSKGRVNCGVIDIDDSHLYSKYEKQNNKCYLSGIEMKWMGGDDRSASIDRVNSDLGYTNDNTMLACSIVNQMKGNMTNYDFLKTVLLIYNERELDKYPSLI